MNPKIFVFIAVLALVGILGGIIVVDFIDMHLAEHRNKLYEHLKNEMKSNRTKHKVLPPSKFGLVQITRQRVRPEMVIKTKEENPNKNGEVEAPIVLIEKIENQLERKSICIINGGNPLHR